MPASTATLQGIGPALIAYAPVLTIAFTTWLGVYTIKAGAVDKQRERERLDRERDDKLRREREQDLAAATELVINNLRKDLAHCEGENTDLHTRIKALEEARDNTLKEAKGRAHSAKRRRI